MQKDQKNQLISDKDRRSVAIQTIVFSILSLIIACLIFEALINQHPVFEFLHYKYNIFKKESIVLGSIFFATFFLGYTILLLAFENTIYSNYRFNIITYFFSVIGLSLITASFIILYQTYNWKLGYIPFYACLFLMISLTGYVFISFFEKAKVFLPFKKILKLFFYLAVFIYLLASVIYDPNITN